MAGAAGLALLHFRHGNRSIIFSDDVKHGVMASRTVVVEVF